MLLAAQLFARGRLLKRSVQDMIDEWTIEPNASIGPLRLGMTKAECEAILGSSSRSFQRTKDSTELIHAYDELHLHVTLNAEGRAVEISAFQPRKVFLSGVQLLGRPLQEVAGELSFSGTVTEGIDVGLYCRDAGVVLVEVEGIVDGMEFRHQDD